MRSSVLTVMACGLLALGASFWKPASSETQHRILDAGLSGLLALGDPTDPERIQLRLDEGAPLALALETPLLQTESMTSGGQALRLAARPAPSASPYGPGLRTPAPAGLADLALPKTPPAVFLAAL